MIEPVIQPTSCNFFYARESSSKMKLVLGVMQASLTKATNSILDDLAI